jgi:SAM-dependent methyltransferase
MTLMWGDIYRRTDAVVRDPRTTADEVATVRRWLEGTAPVSEALDAGCGEGHHLFPLRVDGWKVRGADLFQPRCLGSDLGIFTESSLDRLPFTGGRFSHVYCLNNTAFFSGGEAVVRVLAEFRRVLAPGGRLLLHQSSIGAVESMLLDGPKTMRFNGSCAFTETDSYDPALQRLRIERALEGKTGVCEIQLYDFDDWEGLLAENGFKHDRTDGHDEAMVWVYATKI